MSYPTGNAIQGLGYANQSAGQQASNSPPLVTRFSSYAGQLETRVTHLAMLFDRVSRVADRLGGAVPEEVGKDPNKIRGNGSSIATQFEGSLEDLETITRRAERIVERLETL